MRQLFTGWLAAAAYVFALPGVSLAATSAAVDVIGPHVVESGWRGNAVVFVLHHGEPGTRHPSHAHADVGERSGADHVGCASHEQDHELVVPANADQTSNREVGKARKMGEPTGVSVGSSGNEPARATGHPPVLTGASAVNARAGPLACVRTTVLRI